MTFKIGTRRSALAMAQTEMVKAALEQAGAAAEIVPFTTRGDRILDKPLEKIGGKGVFVAEIEAALQSGEIDIAVHSAKDLPLELGAGLEIGGVLPRGDQRDMLISAGRKFARDEIFTVGTGSGRRRANLHEIYPNARFADIRGNVDTRLKKLTAGEYDAIILCAAGIERLGLDMSDYKYEYLDSYEFVPAPCQGIIAAECKANSAAAEVLAKISDEKTMRCFEFEREVIRLLGADCTSPIGVFSEVRGGAISGIISDGRGGKVRGESGIGERYTLAKELTKKL